MVKVPRTWEECKNEKLKEYYSKIMSKVRAEGRLSYTPPLYLFESTHCWGKEMRVGYDYNIRSGYGSYDFAIGLNKVFDGNEEKAINTICHEIAHCLNPGEHHSFNWQYDAYRLYQWACKEFGLKANVPIRRSSSDKDGLMLPTKVNKVKYVLACPKCNIVIQKYATNCKTVQKPYMYVHSRCKTKLQSCTIEEWEELH